MPSTDGAEADLQPDSDVDPNPDTVSETAIRIVDKQFWLDASSGPLGNGLLNLWLFTIRCPC